MQMRSLIRDAQKLGDELRQGALERQRAAAPAHYAPVSSILCTSAACTPLSLLDGQIRCLYPPVALVGGGQRLVMAATVFGADLVLLSSDPWTGDWPSIVELALCCMRLWVCTASQRASRLHSSFISPSEVML